MQYRILCTLTVLGAPGADPPHSQGAHTMLRKQKGDPALSGAVGPRGAGAALALRTRGGAEVTCKVQQVKMQRCFLLPALELYTNTALQIYVKTPHHPAATALPWQEMQNPGLDHAICSPKSIHIVDTCLKGQTQEGLLSCSFQYACSAIFYSHHFREIVAGRAPGCVSELL